ncbi:MAG: flippase-like domain-containing protein [Pseudomonadota bacterium]
MKATVHLVALAGIALAIGLIVYHGFDKVLDALLAAGWGILWVVLYHLVPLLFSAVGWRALLQADWPCPLKPYVVARWIGEAVNILLPVAQVGGDIVRGRVLTFYGATARLATASVVVDLTLQIVTQLIFTLMGLGLLVATGSDPEVARWALIGVAVALPVVAGFVLAQRFGLFKLVDKMLAFLEQKARWLQAGALNNLHEAVLSLYRDRRALVSSSVYHLLSWITGAGEIWLALHFIGVEVSLAEALIIESLSQAIRSAAFVVPGAYGVQEGGFIALGALFGLSPDVALALSLIKRVRDFTLGVPALAVWQVMEGKRAWLGFGGKDGQPKP